MDAKTLINYILITKKSKELCEKWNLTSSSLKLFRHKFYKGKINCASNNIAKKLEALGYSRTSYDIWQTSIIEMNTEEISGLKPMNRLEDIRNFALNHNIEIYRLDGKSCCYIDFTEGCKPYSEEDNGFLALIKGIENYIIQHGR
jgi:hypothetical protein